MRIVYGVNSEGMGHAMRSAEVIRGLSGDNDLEIVAGGKVADYLEKVGKVRRVHYRSFISVNGKIKQVRTFLYNVVMFPVLIWHFFRLLFSCIVRRPKIIITDFEPLTSYVAFVLRIPLISFDNQHVVTDMEVKKIGSWGQMALYKFLVHYMVPFPRAKIITSFFNPKIKGGNVFLVSPVVRNLISRQKSRKGKRFLVYLSLGGEKVLDILEKEKIKCVVYGKVGRKASKYLKIRKFSEGGFAKDLASSRGVISNAGMTSLGEAIYLGKPILCVPLEGQIEQELNAYYVEEKGFGVSVGKLSREVVERFIGNLGKYERNLEKVKFSNEDVVEKVREVIKKLF